MADQPRELAQRGLRLALVAITALELVGAGVALWLVRRGAGPLLSTSLQRTLAYAWVALTIAAALAAYALAQGAAGATRERRARAALAGAALAMFAALAGIAIFWLVGVWPILLVSLLVGLLGLALGWPATARPIAPAVRPADAVG